MAPLFGVWVQVAFFTGIESVLYGTRWKLSRQTDPQNRSFRRLSHSFVATPSQLIERTTQKATREKTFKKDFVDEKKKDNPAKRYQSTTKDDIDTRTEDDIDHTSSFVPNPHNTRSKPIPKNFYKAPENQVKQIGHRSLLAKTTTNTHSILRSQSPQYSLQPYLSKKNLTAPENCPPSLIR